MNKMDVTETTDDLFIIDTDDLFIIDNELDYPIRLATQSFNTLDNIPMSYTCGNILTEKGVIGVYMQTNLTLLDIVFNQKLYSKSYCKEFARNELQNIIVEFLNTVKCQ